MHLQHSRTSLRRVNNPFTLNILGTASAMPVVSRNPSAQVLDVRGRLFLIDCGEGVQIQLRRAGVSFLKIDIICISHIHGDHLFGLFGLLSTMGMLGRTSDLHIYAPRNFAPVLKFFTGQFGDGIRYSIIHHPLAMEAPETVFSGRTTELLAFPLNHRIDTYGFMVREKAPLLNIRREAIGRYGLSISEIAALKRGEDIMKEYSEKSYLDPEPTLIRSSDVTYVPYIPRSYAYCSDTAPFPELSEWVHGVDLLYHEATFPAEMEEMAAATFHSTTLQAARCAKDACAGKLVVGHYSSRFPDVTPFLDEVRSIFPEAELAREGDIFEIPLKKQEEII